MQWQVVMNKFLKILLIVLATLTLQNSHAQWVNESSINKMNDSVDFVSSITSKSGAKSKFVVRCNSKEEFAHLYLQFPKVLAYSSLKMRVGSQEAQIYEGKLSPDGKFYSTIYDAILILRLQEESQKRLLVEVQWMSPSGSEVIEFNLQGFDKLKCFNRN